MRYELYSYYTTNLLRTPEQLYELEGFFKSQTLENKGFFSLMASLSGIKAHL